MVGNCVGHTACMHVRVADITAFEPQMQASASWLQLEVSTRLFILRRGDSLCVASVAARQDVSERLVLVDDDELALGKT